ncbi:ATP-binding protein [Kurthia sp. YJT4]|uniref:ATP-binding protein n=1 Tax=Kurthia sp. YJT4 TaxID=3049086 RepID=UPI0025511554|nr:ATP-binding protein [Kurthia sp. YJT4]WIL38843.1 ATP-binding protein [Kurthia sp. YJT4]
MKKFDLNIEKVLEHWSIPHALREVISNALDEHILTNTADPIIFKDTEGNWRIKDFGRGLNYEHFTQNENVEKINNPDKVIGKFGVGLKDALATFYRNNVDVFIKSKYSDIRIDKLPKDGFDDISTLHAIVNSPSNPNMIGTEFIFKNINDNHIKEAKDYFLLYSQEKIIEKNKYGQLIENSKEHSRIYVNGICVAKENNLLFSYNITSTTKKLRQSLNRERTNVGRSAYADRLKSILLNCTSNVFAKKLVNDLQKIQTGLSHDELQWIDVQLHACKIPNSQEKVLFLTSNDLMNSDKYLSYAKEDDMLIVTVPDSLANKLADNKDLAGDNFRNLDCYIVEWNKNFKFEFVDIESLTNKEKKIFQTKNQILNWFPKNINVFNDILISNTMRPDMFTHGDTLGVWIPSSKQIIIRRDQLKNMESFTGTLIHELIHAYTNTDDKTIEFEIELTNIIGQLAALILETQKHN